jgi:hypothetical protein
MARQKTTPGDELAALDERIAALEEEEQAHSARQGDAEALLGSFESRRAEARKLRRAGEEVEVPDEAQQGRLLRTIKEAKEDYDEAIQERRQLQSDVRSKVIAAGLPHFDAEAEEAARELEAECEAFLAHRDVVLAKQAAKNEAWRRSYDGRRQLKVEQISPAGFNDLADVPGKVEDVKSKAWPGESEERWREFVKREQAPPAPRVSNREALAQFSGEAV